MASDKSVDPENPDVLAAPKKLENNSYWHRSPIDKVMYTACGANMFMTGSFIYALSGNARWAQFLALCAVPVTMVISIADSKSDYENWKKTQKYREKGLPEKFMPYKSRYDWTKFDAELQEKKKPTFSGVSKSDE